LGCGKGEYTIGLAKLYPEKNFLGIDIKGARIWKGAKTALESKIGNARFLRTRIDFITSCFLPGEVSELWITFPDPQPGKKNKRLTSARFLNRYRNILMNDGFVNLKTDSRELFEYTLHVANYNGLAIEIATSDLYSSGYRSEILSIRTFYESMWLAEGLKICFLRFKLQQHAEIHEPPGTE
jgi:tRNA (guanine-N7-)-methyltransferase